MAGVLFVIHIPIEKSHRKKFSETINPVKNIDLPNEPSRKSKKELEKLKLLKLIKNNNSYPKYKSNILTINHINDYNGDVDCANDDDDDDDNNGDDECFYDDKKSITTINCHNGSIREDRMSIDDFNVGLTSPIANFQENQIKKARSENNLTIDHQQSQQTPNPTIRKSWDGYFRGLVESAKKLKLNYLGKEENQQKQSLYNSLDIENDSTLEQILREILKKMKIKTAQWQKCETGESYHVTFSLEAGGYCHEKMLNLLNEWGIGERDGSSVIMIPGTMWYKPMPELNVDDLKEQAAMYKQESAWNRFMNSMRARLNVAQIVQEVKKNGSINFDFLSLLIIAAILAAFGLIEDSTLFLASSMLISPLMGPIIAATFGTVIKDRSLIKFGLLNEVIGILITTAVGFVFGLICCTIDIRYASGEGLTNEMLSRCEIHSLVVGILIAIPSGAAIAIAILGENIGSLVGVAISASLLPPAVNTGILWALALLFQVYKDDMDNYSYVVKKDDWSDNQSIELAILGAISMAVTITNVICIYFTAALFLKIKEVAPIISKSQRQFWKHDVKVARDFNKNNLDVKNVDIENDNDNFLRHKFAEFNDTTNGHRGGGGGVGVVNSRPISLKNNDLLRNIGRPLYQNTWSPEMTFRHRLHPSQPIPMFNNNRNYNFVTQFIMNGHHNNNHHQPHRSSDDHLMYDQIFGNNNNRMLLKRGSSVPHYGGNGVANSGGSDANGAAGGVADCNDDTFGGSSPIYRKSNDDCPIKYVNLNEKKKREMENRKDDVYSCGNSKFYHRNNTIIDGTSNKIRKFIVTPANNE